MKRRSGRCALVLHIEIRQSQSLSCKVINPWCRNRATLHTDVAPPPVVDKNIDNVGSALSKRRANAVLTPVNAATKTKSKVTIDLFILR